MDGENNEYNVFGIDAKVKGIYCRLVEQLNYGMVRWLGENE